MIFNDVITEIGSRLKGIPSLRVVEGMKDNVVVPAAIVSLPEGIKYDLTYGRGMTSATLEIMILVSRVSDRVASRKILEYTDEEGERSVKAAVDSSNDRPYDSADSIVVMTADFDVVEVSQTQYLGVMFQVSIEGKGKRS